MLALLVCITESISATDGWHMRAPREGRTDVLYWFGQGNRQKGFSRISRPLAAVVSRGSAQSTSHPKHDDVRPLRHSDTMTSGFFHKRAQWLQQLCLCQRALSLSRIDLQS